MPLSYPEAATGGVLQETMCLEILQNSQENTCAEVSFLSVIFFSFFPCEFCEISNNTFFTEHLWATDSGDQEACELSVELHRSSHCRCSETKGVLNIFAKFTGRLQS